MKKKVIALAFLSIIILTPLFSFSIGKGKLGFYISDELSTTNLSSSGSEFISTSGAGLYFDLPLDFKGTTRLIADGTFYYNFDLLESSSFYLYNINKFKFLMTIPLANNVYLEYSMGRDNYKDITGIILDQPLDAISVSIISPTFPTEFFLGYTGLLNTNTTEMFFNNSVNNNKSCYVLSTPNIIASASIKIPKLKENMIASFQVLSLSNISGTQSFANFFSGNIIYSLSENSTVDFTTGLELSSNGFSTFLESLLSFSFSNTKTSLNSSFTITSGNSSALKAFLPITTIYTNVIKTKTYSSLCKASAFFIAGSQKTAFVKIGADTFFNPVGTELISLYESFQWYIDANFNVKDFFKCGLSIGQYIPKSFSSKFAMSFKFSFNF